MNAILLITKRITVVKEFPMEYTYNYKGQLIKKVTKNCDGSTSTIPYFPNNTIETKEIQSVVINKYHLI